jgi:DNA end-binding protein Ku
LHTIWKGAINFGLLNVPVKMGAATSKENVAFKTLHKECNTPLKQKRFCPICNKEVPYEDVVRGYEYEPGRFVIITDEEIENLPIKSAKYISIVDFIKINEVDPVFYEKTYYLAPEKGGEKPYLILRNAMRDTGRVAVAKVALREKEHLCLVRLVNDVLAVETMFFPDEVRSAEEIGIDKLEASVEVRDVEMDMAKQLVENLTAEFAPEKYHDEYREELLKLIRAKIEGQQIIEPAPVSDQPQIIDLMEKLRASVEATKQKPETAAKKRTKKTG